MKKKDHHRSVSTSIKDLKQSSKQKSNKRKSNKRKSNKRKSKQKQKFVIEGKLPTNIKKHSKKHSKERRSKKRSKKPSKDKRSKSKDKRRSKKRSKKPSKAKKRISPILNVYMEPKKGKPREAKRIYISPNVNIPKKPSDKSIKDLKKKLKNIEKGKESKLSKQESDNLNKLRNYQQYQQLKEQQQRYQPAVQGIIQQGQRGSQGPMGPQGIQGPQGVQGARGSSGYGGYGGYHRPSSSSSSNANLDRLRSILQQRRNQSGGGSSNYRGGGGGLTLNPSQARSIRRAMNNPRHFVDVYTQTHNDEVNELLKTLHKGHPDHIDKTPLGRDTRFKGQTDLLHKQLGRLPPVPPSTGKPPSNETVRFDNIHPNVPPSPEDHVIDVPSFYKDKTKKDKTKRTKTKGIKVKSTRTPKIRKISSKTSKRKTMDKLRKKGRKLQDTLANVDIQEDPKTISNLEKTLERILHSQNTFSQNIDYESQDSPDSVTFFSPKRNMKFSQINEYYGRSINDILQDNEALSSLLEDLDMTNINLLKDILHKMNGNTIVNGRTVDKLTKILSRLNSPDYSGIDKLFKSPKEEKFYTPPESPDYELDKLFDERKYSRALINRMVEEKQNKRERDLKRDLKDTPTTFETLSHPQKLAVISNTLKNKQKLSKEQSTYLQKLPNHVINRLKSS